ncbi:MAG: TIGR02452 family protein [Oscillospiraceae bacterium]|nr:TIGR02452 family protein [Oscillospiraceae bacterium]
MNNLEIVSENNRLFKSGKFSGMRSEFIPDFTPTEKPRQDRFVLAENTVKMTTVGCILENAGKKTVALNFANALVPGGGYLLGANAQEESLCRASGLYFTIKEISEFYAQNRKHLLPDYTDGMIFSENVPVIRNDSGELLEQPVLCDFITCPAVNRREAFMMSKEKLRETMERRIEKIVSFAVSKNRELTVLGAFGCGAFGNKREEILPMFENAINRFGGGCEFIFAIP